MGDLVAAATGADKIDAFLYDAARDSLVAVGTSTQPLSALQRQHGLDVLQIANGGRVVHVFKTGQTFVSGRLDQDMEELPACARRSASAPSSACPSTSAASAAG